MSAIDVARKAAAAGAAENLTAMKSSGGSAHNLHNLHASMHNMSSGFHSSNEARDGDGGGSGSGGAAMVMVPVKVKITNLSVLIWPEERGDVLPGCITQVGHR